MGHSLWIKWCDTQFSACKFRSETKSAVEILKIELRSSLSQLSHSRRIFRLFHTIFHVCVFLISCWCKQAPEKEPNLDNSMFTRGNSPNMQILNSRTLLSMLKRPSFLGKKDLPTALTIFSNSWHFIGFPEDQLIPLFFSSPENKANYCFNIMNTNFVSIMEKLQNSISTCKEKYFLTLMHRMWYVWTQFIGEI